jgi:hypothetical protein
VGPRAGLDMVSKRRTPSPPPQPEIEPQISNSPAHGKLLKYKHMKLKMFTDFRIITLVYFYIVLLVQK